MGGWSAGGERLARAQHRRTGRRGANLARAGTGLAVVAVLGVASAVAAGAFAPQSRLPGRGGPPSATTTTTTTMAARRNAGVVVLPSGPRRRRSHAPGEPAATPSSTRPPSSLAPAGTAPAGTAPAGTAPAGTAPAGTAPAGTAPAGTAPATLAPGEVLVEVLNGTGTPLQAARVAASLRAAGFAINGTGNAASFGHPTTIVAYPPGAEDAAQILAAHLSGGYVIEGDDSLPAGVVDLVTGDSFSGVTG